MSQTLYGVAVVVVSALIPSCAMTNVQSTQRAPAQAAFEPFAIVLGIAQDGGVPHAGCRRACCEAAWNDAELHVPVSCLGIVDPADGRCWIIDATPDFPQQLHRLRQASQVQTTGLAGAAGGLRDESPRGMNSAARPGEQDAALAGIFLTHAHIGHYTGLMHLGREVMGARAVPVYAMPRMRGFLESNGPWDQLIRLRHIELRPLEADAPVQLNERLRVTPMLVPHRDEYSETVAFRIDGPCRRLLYLPDIDKWERWERRIEDEIAGVDMALLDGTFFSGDEMPGRDISQVPHPFIQESLRRFEPLSAQQRAKVRFIHLNHTNPALKSGHAEHRWIESQGLHIAGLGERFAL